MKILYSHYLADDGHPAVRMIHAIGEGLRDLGHDVWIHRSYGDAGPRSTATARPKTGRLSALRGKLWFAKAIARNSSMGRRDLAAIDAFRPDVVLARQDAYCDSMARAAERRRVPLVTYADAPVAYETRHHGDRSRWHPPGLVEAIERRTLRRSRAVIAVSNPAAGVLADYGVEVPIEVIPNGVHPERFPELSDSDRRRGRLALGIEAPHVLGFQGGFQSFHGLDRLRDLMLWTARRPDVHWLMIGDGPGRAALEQAVAGRVRATFLGRRPPESMGPLLGLIDIALAPHEFAGVFYFCPLKILEYTAAGCAIIAGDQGDVSSLLDDGRAGILVADGEFTSWTNALDRALDDPTGSRERGRAARSFVLRNLTWRITAEKVAGVLDHVVHTSEAIETASRFSTSRAR